MSEKIHKTEDILNYLDGYKKIRNDILEQNKLLNIKIKPPNLSEEVTESLACKVINDGSILVDRFGHGAIAERFGKSGIDILVNGITKLECKGTTSLSGFISVSKTNIFERDAWIWLNFNPYIHNESPIIEVHIIHYPDKCIMPKKIEANGESKMTMASAIKLASKLGYHESHDLNASTMIVNI